MNGESAGVDRRHQQVDARTPEVPIRGVGVGVGVGGGGEGEGENDTWREWIAAAGSLDDIELTTTLLAAWVRLNGSTGRWPTPGVTSRMPTAPGVMMPRAPID